MSMLAAAFRRLPIDALTARSVLSVYRVMPLSDGKSERSLDFDLPIVIPSDIRALLQFGNLLGLLLMVPQLITVNSNTNLEGYVRAGLSVLIIVFNLLAGTFAAFNLKKTI
jgi:hypothetical protein